MESPYTEIISYIFSYQDTHTCVVATRDQVKSVLGAINIINITMNSQPNEIISHILSYLDNRTLILARRVCHKWKNLIEKIFYKPVLPPLHVCIINRDYYYFGKHYLNYKYLNAYCISEYAYYYYLAELVGDPIFLKQFASSYPQYKKHIRRDHRETIKELVLLYGATNGHIEVVKYLIEKGANIHYDKESVLRGSIISGKLEIIKYLMSNGIDIHTKIRDDNLLFIAVENNQLAIVEYLVNQGTDIHEDNDNAICMSAFYGHFSIVDFLVKHGADIHALNDEPLRASVMNGHLATADHLIKHGANINVIDDTVLRECAKYDRIDMMKYIIITQHEKNKKN